MLLNREKQSWVGGQQKNKKETRPAVFGYPAHENLVRWKEGVEESAVSPQQHAAVSPATNGPATGSPVGASNLRGSRSITSAAGVTSSLEKEGPVVPGGLTKFSQTRSRSATPGGPTPVRGNRRGSASSSMGPSGSRLSTAPATALRGSNSSGFGASGELGRSLEGGGLPHDIEALQQLVRRMEREEKMHQHEQRQFEEHVKHDFDLHKKTIEKLRRDNKELRQMMQLEKGQLASGNALKRAALSEANQIVSLQKQVERYRSKLDVEKAKLQELAARHNRLEHLYDTKMKQLAQNRVALPLPGYKDTRVINIEEHRRVERRVEALQLKLRAQKDENKELQAQIDELREKHIRNFDAQYDRLCAEIEDKKQKNHLLEEQLRKMRLARDSAQSEVSALTLQFEREKEQWQRELLSQKRELDAKRLAYDYLTEVERNEAAKRDRERQRVEEDFAALQRHHIEQQAGEGGNAEVEAILHRICSATNTKTLDEALEEIRGVEESKMSLMRYINELTDTNRKLEEELRLKEEVIRKDEMDGLMWEPSETDKKRKEEIEELKSKLEKLEGDKEVQLSKFKELSCLFMDIKTGVLSLCEKLELVPPSDSASAPTVSLASTVVDEHVLDLLKKVEERVVDLVLRKERGDESYATWKPGDGSHMEPLGEHSLHTENVNKFLRQLVDEEDADESSRPILDREALKRQSIQRVLKMEREDEAEGRRKKRMDRSNRTLSPTMGARAPSR